MKERRLLVWALSASLLFHLGFLVYSREIRINLGVVLRNVASLQLEFVSSAPNEFSFRTVKRDLSPPTASDILSVPDSIPQPRGGMVPYVGPTTAPLPNLGGPAGTAQVPSNNMPLGDPGAPVPVMTVESRAHDNLLEAIAGEPGTASGTRTTYVEGGGPRYVVAPRTPPPPPTKSAIGGPGPTTVANLRGGPSRREEIKVEPPRIRPPQETRPSLATTEAADIDRRNYENIEAYLDFKLETFHNPRGEGFFRVTVKPNQKALTLPVLRKDIVFCVDASRSIGPLTFKELQKGLTTCIARLRPEDRFNLIGFETKDTRFADGLVPAGEQAKEGAIKLLSRFRAEGLTNIYSALVPISQIGGGLNHPFIIVLLSDGRPNRGVLDSSKIINDMTEGIKVNSSVFALGVGPKTNRYLLDLLTLRNKGRSYEAPQLEAVDYEVRQLFNRVADPLMINVEYRFSGGLGDASVPRQLPDLYRNGDLILLGRMGAEKSATLYVSGQFTDVRRHALFSRPFPAKDNGGPDVEKDYGYYLMYQIIEQICKEGRNPALLQQLDLVSQQHGVPRPDYANMP